MSGSGGLNSDFEDERMENEIEDLMSILGLTRSCDSVPFFHISSSKDDSSGACFGLYLLNLLAPCCHYSAKCYLFLHYLDGPSVLNLALHGHCLYPPSVSAEDHQCSVPSSCLPYQ